MPIDAIIEIVTHNLRANLEDNFIITRDKIQSNNDVPISNKKKNPLDL